MSKVKSGLVLVAVAIGMNVTGRIMASQLWVLASPSPMFIGFFALLMVASVVVGLFGVFRLVVGLLTRKKRDEPSEIIPPTEGVWPLPPKTPGGG